MSDISKRRWEIDRARNKKMQELMEEYDRDVYYPAKRQLFADCLADGGHRGGKYHDNGFGWSWFYCGRCGDRYDITGPNGETKEMNLKYKELAEQAWDSLIDEMGDVYREDGLNWDFLHAYDKRYAESIVRQCADQCLSDDYMRILNHFGIKK